MKSLTKMLPTSAKPQPIWLSSIIIKSAVWESILPSSDEPQLQLKQVALLNQKSYIKSEKQAEQEQVKVQKNKFEDQIKRTSQRNYSQTNTPEQQVRKTSRGQQNKSEVRRTSPTNNEEKNRFN